MTAPLHHPVTTITYSTPHTVTLSVLDWSRIQMQLAHAACLSDQRNEPATAKVIRDLLDKLREQNMRVIDATRECDE